MPAKDSDIGWGRSVIRSDRRDDLVFCDGDHYQGRVKRAGQFDGPTAWTWPRFCGIAEAKESRSWMTSFTVPRLAPRVDLVRVQRGAHKPDKRRR